MQLLIIKNDKWEDYLMKLEVKNIQKSFSEVKVLKDVTFEVVSGKALGLLGRNGAGKTTTIRILMDVFHANAGEILLDGKPFVPSNHQIGYLPEERGLYPKKTVIDQMVYLAKLRGLSKSEAIKNSKKWLERLGISEYETKKLETLSKGNQQKVQLASTLVSEPEIIILDEPFSGLDPVNSQVLQEVVRELIGEGRIVIFSSHQMSYVEEFCEHVAIIDKGEVVLVGELDAIKREYGKDQLVVSATNYKIDELDKILEQNFKNYLTVKGRKKEELIIRLNGDTKRNTLLEQLIKQNIEIEHFETYKPSLNDIFVAKVGE